ncbi:MAG TPA: hypothetical protein V6C72_15280 [Chroococcales cyanobacterium]
MESEAVGGLAAGLSSRADGEVILRLKLPDCSLPQGGLERCGESIRREAGSTTDGQRIAGIGNQDGLRQKVLRNEISEPDLARTFRIFEDDCLAEKIQRKSVPWTAVYLQAEKISRKFSLTQICRSFDLLHVAIADASNMQHFATLDRGQSNVARAVGLRPVDFETA